MTDKTVITLSEREINILLSWIYDDFKPQSDIDVDKHLITKIRNACKRLDCEYLIEEWDVEKPDGLTPDELQEIENRKDEIADMEGKFLCPKCNIRTNEKTYQTKCVICNTSLIRG